AGWPRLRQAGSSHTFQHVGRNTGNRGHRGHREMSHFVPPGKKSYVTEPRAVGPPTCRPPIGGAFCERCERCPPTPAREMMRTSRGRPRGFSNPFVTPQICAIEIPPRLVYIVQSTCFRFRTEGNTHALRFAHTAGRRG